VGLSGAQTGIPELDAYLNQTQAGASYAKPITYTPPPVAAPATPTVPATTVAEQDFGGNGTMRTGGMVPRRAEGGDTGMGLPDYGGGVEVPVYDDAAPPASESPPSATPDSPPPPKSRPAPDTSRGMGPHGPGNGPLAQRGMGAPPVLTGGLPELPPDVVANDQRPNAGASKTPDNRQRGMGSATQGMRSDDTPKPNDTTQPYHPDKADPWLALAMAGFGMAAGKSPHALENIGAGAERGVQFYAQQQDQANKNNLTARDTQARIDESRAYHTALAGNSADKNLENVRWHDMESANTQERMAMMMAMKQMSENGNKGFVPYGFDQDGNALVMNRTDGSVHNTGIQGGMTPGQRAADARDTARTQALQTYREWLMQHGDASQAETERYHDYLKSKGATDEDIRVWGQSKDIMGKPTMTPGQAGQAGDQFRGRNTAPAVTPPPAATGAPPPVANPNVSTLWGN
jgi:hypothetical protein